jgi:hypothetical protein
MLCDIRKLQLTQSGATNKRLGETDDLFRYTDNILSGIVPAEKFSEVMTFSDFPNAFGDWVQRQMVPGYNTKRFDFEMFTKPDTAPNYQLVTRKQKRAGLEDLEYVGEKGEARPGSVVDSTDRQYRVYRWEKQFDFSMEALVNDDLGYFNDQTRLMGIAARRTLEKYASRWLWNTTIIARLTALGALYQINGRLTSSRISTARMAFNQRLDARNEPIAARLAFIVHPPELVDTVRVIRASELIPELATNAANVIAGDFIPIEDPYAPGTAPNIPWFAMTNWREDNVVPFVLVRRQGVPAARIYRMKSNVESIGSLLGGGSDVAPIVGDFINHDIVVKVADEWGTYRDNTDGNMIDHRGCFYSSGTAV